MTTAATRIQGATWARKVSALLAATMALALTPTARSAVPGAINYQGFLTDAISGQPLSAAVVVSFKLYDAVTAGNLIYSETQTVTPATGVFNVQIGGAGGALAFSSVAFDKPYWLEIAIGGQTLTPRQPLASSATALRARVAESLPPVPGTGASNTALGFQALAVNTTGGGNTSVGAGVLQANSQGNNNTGVGGSTLYYNVSGNLNTAVGTSALEQNVSGNENTALGTSALFHNVAGSGNTALGISALVNGTGNSNIALGGSAGSNLTTGNYNIAIGNAGVAGEGNTIRIGDNNQTRIFMAGVNGVTLPGAQTVVISSTGQLGVTGAAGTGGGNVAYGPTSLVTNTTGSNNTALGQAVLQSNTTGAFNTAAGVGALNANSAGTANAALGSNALVRNTTGNNNVSVGDASTANNTMGSNNTALGQGSLLQNISGSNNLALGAGAGSALTVGNYNIDIANAGVAGEGNTIRIGDGNQTRAFVAGINGVGIPGAQTVVVSSSGQLGVAAASGTGTGNVSYGSAALASNTTGAYNTAAGIAALNANTSGTANVALGSNALVRNTNGSGNVSVGDASSANNTTGSRNTAIGQLALAQNINGVGNIAIGYLAGDNLSDAIIGTGCNGCPLLYNDNNIEIGNPGVYTDRNLIRIGNNSHTATYIAGALYNPSDRNLKQNFAAVDALDVLKKLAALPLSRWTYKNDDQNIHHLGPVAQDFRAAFGLGADDKHIATIDEGGVALAAIKGLYQELLATQARAQAKDEELSALKRELQQIKSQLGLK
jgi:hypothetical protein